MEKSKMKHLGTKELETESLLLRRFRKDDAEAMYRNWASDPEVTKYLMWPTHKNISISETVLEDWVENYADKTYYQWAIILKSEGPEPIGSISIVRQDKNVKMVHVGYCIGRKWWHQGITSEALDRVVSFFFEEVRVNRFESRFDPRNANSGKVMEKCGLLYEGTMRQGDWNNQGICDYSMYGLVRDDYEKNRNL